MSWDTSPVAERSRPLGADFSALLTATLVTNLGDGLRLVALPLLATTLTSSPFVIAALTATQFLPWATFAPFGGVMVDRADRRRLIMVTQAWRSALMAVLGVLVLVGAAQIWQLFVVSFMITVGEILVDPSVVATVPTIVAGDDLDRANGRISTVETVTNDFLGGPAGAASFAVAPWLPFVLDALSYLASIVPFGRLPATWSRRVEGESGAAVRIEAGEGLRWIIGHDFLRRLTVAMAVFHLGTAGAFALLILLATDVLGASGLTYGAALSAAAIGATVASLVAARLAAALGRRVVMSSAAVSAALSVLAAGAARSEWQLLAAWTVNGAAGGIMLSIGRGFVQRHTPNDRLGRTAIASRMVSRSAFVVGALISGVIADSTSVRWAFVASGLFHLAGAALIGRAFRFEPASRSSV